MITRAVDDLPEDLDPELVAHAEAHLIAEAAEYDAKTLKILGRRLLEVIAPDIADAHEAKLLEREERAAAAATRLTMWEDGHGKVHGRFTLDALHGADAQEGAARVRRPQTPAPARDHSGNAGRPRSGSGRRSPRSSSATPSTSSPRPAGSTPPSWS